MINKLNSTLTGALIGLIFPLIAAIIFHQIFFSEYELLSFLYRSILIGVHLKLISICVFTNLLAFFIFIWLNFLYAARGVLLATFLYAFVVFILKFTV